MTDPFSPAGRFEQRCLDADQQRAQEAARRKAKEQGVEPPDWAKPSAVPVPDGEAVGTALGKALVTCFNLLGLKRTSK